MADEPLHYEPGRLLVADLLGKSHSAAHNAVDEGPLRTGRLVSVVI